MKKIDLSTSALLGRALGNKKNLKMVVNEKMMKNAFDAANQKIDLTKSVETIYRVWI